MNRRVLWAIVASVLLHLCLIAGVQLEGLVDSLHALESEEAPAQQLVMEVRLLSGARASKAAPDAVPPPRAQKAAQPDIGVSAGSSAESVQKVQVDAQPVAVSRSELGTVPLAEGVSAGNQPMGQAAREPLVLELPAHWSNRVHATPVPQALLEPDRARPTAQPVGSVGIHEVQGSMGDRRATVTTPWGRYCMRERRAAGPYDARRDRGMDSMTCPDG